MTSYTVTITPDDPDLAVTTVRLDLVDGAATVRELRLQPGSGGGLRPGDLPVLDLNQLVQTVLAATGGAAAPARRTGKAQPATAAAAQPGGGTAKAPASAAPAKPTMTGRAATKATKAARTQVAAAKAGRAPARRAVPAGSAAEGRAKADAAMAAVTKASAAKAAPRRAARTADSPAKAAPGKAAPAKTATRSTAPAKATRKAAAAEASGNGAGSRTYRRLPDDFAEVLRQAGGSASVIADHYGVPRHTAYGWIRTAGRKTSAS